MKKLIISGFVLFLWSSCNAPKSINSTEIADSSKINVLIIDGENNHGVWPKTTVMIKSLIEETGLFNVDVMRKAYVWQGPHSDEILGSEGRNQLLEKYAIQGVSHLERVQDPKVDPNFNPNFKKYEVVISNLGWKSSTWPPTTQIAFESYMKEGGGLVVFHAADNSFGDWPAFNEMIGLGGWGGRSEKTGPYVFYNDDGKEVRDPSVGACGSHGPGQEFILTTRAPNHPIMKGLPLEWLHTKDELYDRLRGPAKHMTILATAYSDRSKNAPPWNKDVSGTGHHEPQLMTINYYKGRVFHSTLGHNDYSIECIGFRTTFQRGVEWAATGNVTQQIPTNFPTKSEKQIIKWVD